MPAAPVAPGALQLQSLPLEVQEQLFGVLRAALDASLVPLLEKQQELEARLEALQDAPARPRMASIPVTLGPSIAPGPSSVAPAPVAFETTPTQPLPSVAPKTASLVPTSYGFVIAPEGPPRRPSIDIALENVGPIDMPDFGRRRRIVGRLLVGLLLAGLFAAIAATVLSHT